jgi:hypothetical protein
MCGDRQEDRRCDTYQSWRWRDEINCSVDRAAGRIFSNDGQAAQGDLQGDRRYAIWALVSQVPHAGVAPPEGGVKPASLHTSR